MQTLISAFDDSVTARRAVARLLDAGFAREDVHLQEAPDAYAAAADAAVDRELGERAMHSAEREVAVDRSVVESIGNFFTSLFGLDHTELHAGYYTEAVRAGRCVVVVDTQDEGQKDRASSLMYELGAIDVNGSGVRVFEHNTQRPLREIVAAHSAASDEASSAPVPATQY